MMQQQQQIIDRLDKFDNKFELFFTNFEKMSERVAFLENKVAALEEQHKQQPKLFSAEYSAEDPAETKERSRSIVISGLSESTKPTATAKHKDDVDRVETVLDLLGVEASPQMVYRLGKPDPARSGRHRSLKVVLPASTFQRFALRQWGVKGGNKRPEVRRVQGFERLFIRPSLSKQQLQEEYEERVKKRNEGGVNSGKSNITIRKSNTEEKNI
jgi:hypothetical protein